jgi:hypothetical protein
VGRDLREERDALSARLHAMPRLPVHAPAGSTGIGECSISMLLTGLSYWRGAGAILFSAGVWPRWREDRNGPLFELGPVLSQTHPLLTDDQIIRLLC